MLFNTGADVPLQRGTQRQSPHPHHEEFLSSSPPHDSLVKVSACIQCVHGVCVHIRIACVYSEGCDCAYNYV